MSLLRVTDLGIRYDGSAPHVVGNLIFDNQRSGIYASGKTTALVEGNVFLGTGSSHWFASADRVYYHSLLSHAIKNRQIAASLLGITHNVKVLQISNSAIDDLLVVNVNWRAESFRKVCDGDSGDAVARGCEAGRVGHAFSKKKRGELTVATVRLSDCAKLSNRRIPIKALLLPSSRMEAQAPQPLELWHLSLLNSGTSASQAHLPLSGKSS